MKFMNNTPVIKSLAIAGAVSLAFFGSSELRSSQVVEVASTSSQPYVLSVSDTIAVTDLVISVGGEVGARSSLGIIEASLTSEQLELVSRSASVSRISNSAEEYSDSLSSSELSSELQVAGWYWGR